MHTIDKGSEGKTRAMADKHKELMDRWLAAGPGIDKAAYWGELQKEYKDYERTLETNML